MPLSLCPILYYAFQLTNPPSTPFEIFLDLMPYVQLSEYMGTSIVGPSQ